MKNENFLTIFLPQFKVSLSSDYLLGYKVQSENEIIVLDYCKLSDHRFGGTPGIFAIGSAKSIAELNNIPSNKPYLYLNTSNRHDDVVCLQFDHVQRFMSPSTVFTLYEPKEVQQSHFFMHSRSNNTWCKTLISHSKKYTALLTAQENNSKYSFPLSTVIYLAWIKIVAIFIYVIKPLFFSRYLLLHYYFLVCNRCRILFIFQV